MFTLRRLVIYHNCPSANLDDNFSEVFLNHQHSYEYIVLLVQPILDLPLWCYRNLDRPVHILVYVTRAFVQCSHIKWMYMINNYNFKVTWGIFISMRYLSYNPFFRFAAAHNHFQLVQRYENQNWNRIHKQCTMKTHNLSMHTILLSKFLRSPWNGLTENHNCQRMHRNPYKLCNHDGISEDLNWNGIDDRRQQMCINLQLTSS